MTATLATGWDQSRFWTTGPSLPDVTEAVGPGAQPGATWPEYSYGGNAVRQVGVGILDRQCANNVDRAAVGRGTGDVSLLPASARLIHELVCATRWCRIEIHELRWDIAAVATDPLVGNPIDAVHGGAGRRLRVLVRGTASRQRGAN